MPTAIPRRALLIGAGAALGCSLFGSPRQDRAAVERARALMLGDDIVPAQISDALRRGEFGVESLREVSTALALTRCTPDGGDTDGSVSHALLGVHAAMRIEKRCGAPTRDLLWVTVAWLVAREVARSPYVASPFHLPEPGSPTMSLVEAIRRGDVAAADAAASSGRARAELVRAAMEQFGHLGHGALFAATALGLGDAHGALPDRCAARYLASFRRPDDTRERIAERRGPLLRRVTAAGGVEAQCEALVDGAIDLLDRCPRVGIGNMHLFTCAEALCQITAQLPRAPIVGAAWLDAAAAGASELGALDRGEPYPPDHGRRVRAVLGPRPGDIDRIVHFACELARRTFHHSIKLVSAMLHRPAASALTVDFLASVWNGKDDDMLEPARQILGIDPS